MIMAIHLKQIELKFFLLWMGTIGQLSAQSQSDDASGGHCHKNDDEYKMSVMQLLFIMEATFFEEGLKNLALRYYKWLINGNYVEM